jgi:hypothetical protein
VCLHCRSKGTGGAHERCQTDRYGHAVTPELQADWEAAASDARTDPALVVLYPLASAGRFGAMHFPPGRWPHAYDNEFAYNDQRARGDTEMIELARSVWIELGGAPDDFREPRST